MDQLIQEVHDFRQIHLACQATLCLIYLPGVKIQVFHGYAAEKKDHWIIRRYFDTYFTQGPYFILSPRGSGQEIWRFRGVGNGMVRNQGNPYSQWMPTLRRNRSGKARRPDPHAPPSRHKTDSLLPYIKEESWLLSAMPDSNEVPSAYPPGMGR